MTICPRTGLLEVDLRSVELEAGVYATGVADRYGGLWVAWKWLRINEALRTQEKEVRSYYDGLCRYLWFIKCWIAYYLIDNFGRTFDRYCCIKINDFGNLFSRKSGAKAKTFRANKKLLILFKQQQLSFTSKYFYFWNVTSFIGSYRINWKIEAFCAVRKR